MSKLNKKSKSTLIKKADVKMDYSYNGNLQYVKSADQQLYELCVNSLYGKDTYYESNDDRLARMINCVNSVVKDKKYDFCANLAIYARGTMNIRSMPILLVVYFAKALRDKGVEYANMRAVVRDVIQRADQITDLYAVALSVFKEKGKIPMAIKRGVADSFCKFSEYQFQKYNRDGSVKLSDVLRIVHPKAFDALQGGVFERIRDDALATPYTWETQLSANGSLPKEKQKSKKQLWTELAMSGIEAWVEVA